MQSISTQNESPASSSARGADRSSSTKAATTPPTAALRDSQVMEVFGQLIRTSEGFAKALQRELQAVGLTTSQLGVLETLYHLGPMCQRDIGEQLNKSRGNVTTVVDNLERRGLVERVRNEDDRRYITLKLKPKGRETVQRVYPQHTSRIREVMNSLTVAERDALASLCAKLEVALEEEDEG